MTAPTKPPAPWLARAEVTQEIRSFAPHLQSLGGESANILDHMGSGVILVDADLKLFFSNKAAPALLGEGGQMRLDGRERLAGSSERISMLKAAVSRMVRENCCVAAVLDADGLHPATVAVVMPFQPEAIHMPRCALIILRSQEAFSRGAVGMVRTLFGLTPAEAEIAVELATGADLGEIAEKRTVSLSTIRTQVAAVMAKTGTRRQAGLVALLARLGSLA